MADTFDTDDSISARREAEALIVDVDGFEGPLDVLLTLSRSSEG
jgi:segregation and condensation protein A